MIVASVRHTANIYQKLDVHGRRGAMERAGALGLLESPRRIHNDAI